MRLLAARIVGLPRGGVEVKANAHHERLAAEGGVHVRVAGLRRDLAQCKGRR